MPSPLLFPAPEWGPPLSEHVVLWHGCTLNAKDDIEASGIDLARCAVNTDFGRGFYTTTLERQARLWAWKQFALLEKRYPGAPGNSPVVLRLRVRRYTRTHRRGPIDDGLDGLNSLQFVRGDYDAEEYWSFVQHCRQSVPAEPLLGITEVVIDHGRAPNGWYQLVCGPVSASWEQKAAMAGADQYSFHEGGTSLLDALIGAGQGGGPDGAGDPDYYQWFDVT